MATTRKNLASDLNDQGAAIVSVSPKTPQDFMLQAQTYLMAMNPSVDEPRHDFHYELLQGLDLAREQLSRKEAPRVTVASKIVQPTRQKENTGKAVEIAPANPSQRIRHKLNPREEADRTSARRARRSEYEDDPRDMRSKIA